MPAQPSPDQSPPDRPSPDQPSPDRPPLDLRPMTAQSFQRFLGRAAPQYAAEKVRSGQWSQAGAEARAYGDFALLLPLGPDTPDHTLLDLHCGAEQVGVLWYALRGEGQGRSAFVYEVEIFAPYRRRGLAGAAFGTLERRVRAEGAAAIELHVFGHNHAARALYGGLGFAPTSLILRKEV